MRERFESLQALRGVACLLVVAYHAAGWEARFGLGFNPLKPTTWFGYAGVDLFFVLSGFIIASTCRPALGRPGQLPSYLFRRAWRLFPAYWAALALTIVVYCGLAEGWVFRPGWTAEVVDTLLLLPQVPTPRIVPVAWTLSYELMFYAGFAMLFLLPARAAVPALIAWAAVVLWCACAGHTPAGRYASLAVSPFVLEFLAGALVAWLPAKLSGRWAAAVFGLALAWCGVGLAATFDPDPVRLAVDPGGRVLVFGIPAAIAVFALTGWERGGGRMRRGRLSAVGDASYSIYLLHGPFLMLMMYLTMRANMSHTRVPHCAWVALIMAAGVLPGMLFHRYIEAPLLRLGKRKRPTAATVSHAVPTRRAA